MPRTPNWAVMFGNTEVKSVCMSVTHLVTAAAAATLSPKLARLNYRSTMMEPLRRPITSTWLGLMPMLAATPLTTLLTKVSCMAGLDTTSR